MKNKIINSILSLSILSTGLSYNDIIEPATISSKSYSQKLNNTQFENIKISNLIEDIKNKAMIEFQTINNKIINKNNIVVIGYKGGIDASFLSFDKLSYEKAKKEKYLKGITKKTWERIDSNDNGLVIIKVNNDILKKVVSDNVSKKYIEDFKNILIGFIKHESTHKIGDLKGNSGELSAGIAQDKFISSNSELIDDLNKIGFRTNLIDSLKENLRYSINRQLEDNKNGTKLLDNKTLKMNNILLKNIDKIFILEKEQLSYFYGDRIIDYKKTLFPIEYLQNITKKQIFDDQGESISITAGYLFNINKVLIENGYSKSEILNFNKSFSDSDAIFEMFEELYSLNNIKDVSKKTLEELNLVTTEIYDKIKKSLTKNNNINNSVS